MTTNRELPLGYGLWCLMPTDNPGMKTVVWLKLSSLVLVLFVDCCGLKKLVFCVYAQLPEM